MNRISIPGSRRFRIGATLLELLVAILVTGLVVAMAFQILVAAFHHSKRREQEGDRAALIQLFRSRLGSLARSHPRLCDDPGVPGDGRIEAVRDSLDTWLARRATLVRFDCVPDPSGRIPAALAWRLHLDGWNPDPQGRIAR